LRSSAFLSSKELQARVRFALSSDLDEGITGLIKKLAGREKVVLFNVGNYL